MRLIFKDKDKKNKGFTLVELIVTMLLLSILLAVSVTGLLAWQDWSDFNQANEYAEAMFLAAQNQLSEYNTNGTLENFAKEANKGDNSVNLSDIYYEDGKTYQEDTVWTTANKGTLVSVRCNKGDYNLYKSGKNTTSDTASAVFTLLEGYLYDTSILNDTICIEFSLEDGQVFSVLYSAKSDGSGVEKFVYDDSVETKTGNVNIATRYESYRKERMVGYYGVDTLSKSLVADKEQISVDEIKLNNEETLNLTFKLSDVNKTGGLKYEVTIYDMETGGGEAVLKLSFDGAIENSENRKNKQCNVVRYVKSGSGEAVTQDLGEFPVLMWTEEDGTVRIVLDAADYQATSASYIDSLDTLKSDDASGISKDTFTFKNTYSFHRFGLDAEKIKCSVVAYSDTVEKTTERFSNQSYVYFADENSNYDENTGLANFNYSIANARHLYNMRYVTDLSANTVKSEDELKKSCSYYGKYEEATAVACHFQLTSDIDWKEFCKNDYFYNTESNNIIIDEASSDLADDFVSMKQLRIYDTFSGKDDEEDKNHKISGLTITKTGNQLSSVYDEDDKKQPVGLFAVNYGAISNLTLDNIQATSSGDYVGAFAGINVCGVLDDGSGTGLLDNLTVLSSAADTNQDKASAIKGNEYVGGIVGKLEGLGSASSVSSVGFTGLNNEAKVTGKKYVGGITGELRTPSDRAVSITLDDCHNYGAVYASVKNDEDKADSRFIGGIVGICANEYGAAHSGNDTLITIKNSSSRPKYSDDDLETLAGASGNLSDYADNAVGTYVGGITGFSYYSTLTNVGVKNSDIGSGTYTGYVFGDSFVGGIAGYYIGTSSLSGAGSQGVSYANDSYVIGSSYVGGITGLNADIDEAALRNAAGDSSSKLITVIEDSAAVITLSASSDTARQVDSWTNYGIVYGTDKYVGGITGYNTGTVLSCDNKSGTLELNDTALQYNTDTAADYVGGIAGYNKGSLSSGTAVTPYVVGDSYVGGVVGYNDDGADVTGYSVAGGSVLGDTASGCYVGGLCGFNASVLMLQNTDGTAKSLTSNISTVSGAYFVGGGIGGNIINTNGYSQIIITETGTGGSSSGSTPGSAGGSKSEECYVKVTTENLYSGEYSFELYNDSDEDITSWYLVIHIPEGASLNWGPYRGELTKEVKDDETLCTFYPIPNQYNNLVIGAHSNTGVENHFSVSFSEEFSEEYIEFYYVGGDGKGVLNSNEANADDKTYAFTITGTESDDSYTAKKLTINNNSDNNIIDWYIEIPLQDNDNIETQNWVENMKVSIETDNETRCLVIKPLSYTDKKILKGGNVELSTSEWNRIFKVNGSQDTYNRLMSNAKLVYYTEASGSIDTIQYARINANAAMSDFSGSVTGTAFTGGFIGYTMLVDSTDTSYAGNMAESLMSAVGNKTCAEAVSAVASVEAADSKAQLYMYGTVGKGSVSAETYAGGLLGYADDTMFMYIDNATNNSSVTAKSGYAGGITGASLYADNKITTCFNYGTVTARDVAGGIAAVNNGTISACVVNADIIGGLGASYAAYGGIAGISGTAEAGADGTYKAAITECSFDGTITGASNTITANVGGIAGINGKDSELKSCVTGKSNDSGSTYVRGGMVNGTEYSQSRANTGGIAGTNYGLISGSDNKTESSDTVLVDNFIGYTGGIAGYNGAGASINGEDGDNLTTSDKWTVICKSSEKASAAGGIAGMSQSANGFSYVSNNASVQTSGSGAVLDNAAGGIVGIYDCQAETAFTKCYNYGAVINENSGYAGALIGVLKQGDISFASCSNNGTITGTMSIDPMIGYAYTDNVSLAFDNCTNNGATFTSYQAVAAAYSDESLSGTAQASLEDEVYAYSPDEELSDTTESSEDTSEEATETDAEAVVKLDTPSLDKLGAYKTVRQYYDGEGFALSDEDINYDEGYVPVAVSSAEEASVGDYIDTRAYTLTLSDNADYYTVQFTDKESRLGIAYIEPSEEGYKVYYIGTGAGSISETGACMGNPYGVYVGTVDEDNYVCLPYCDYAKLIYDGGEISILLPEQTTLVAEQANVGEDNIDRYESSDIAVWRLDEVSEATPDEALPATEDEADTADKGDNTVEITEEIEPSYVESIQHNIVLEYSDDEAVNDTDIGLAGAAVNDADASNKLMCTVDTDKACLVHVLVVDSDNNITDSEYFVVCAENPCFSLDGDTVSAEGSYAMIRFADIGDNGICDWTDFVTLE